MFILSERFWLPVKQEVRPLAESEDGGDSKFREGEK